jgi:hypothetical protein
MASTGSLLPLKKLTFFRGILSNAGEKVRILDFFISLLIYFTMERDYDR